ncbi:MAG: YndJ family transporter, partial [Verrucomicrobiota bacterium]
LADDLAPAPRRCLEMLSATGPLVAAAAWIWSRYDRSFAGFPDRLATLTTVHFAITFGVLPLAMAASERPLTRCRWRDFGLWLYVAGAPATALCFALRADPLRPGVVEVACAALFAAGFLLWAAFMPFRRGPWPYVCLVPGFLLGVGYTAAHAFGWDYLTIPQMASVHGSLNLLGSLLLGAQAPAFADVAAPAPDLATPVEAGDRGTAVFVDTHRVTVGPWSPDAFARVKAALLGYRFYPEHVMARRTQFEDEGRAVSVGDRLGLGLFVPNLPGLAPLMLPAIVEVDAVEVDEERVVLGYVTTRRHYGRGSWRAEVRRPADAGCRRRLGTRPVGSAGRRAGRTRRTNGWGARDR